MVLFVEVHLKKKKKKNCMGGLNVTDVKRWRIPMLWNTVRERALAKGFSFNTGRHEVSVCLHRVQTYLKISKQTFLFI